MTTTPITDTLAVQVLAKMLDDTLASVDRAQDATTLALAQLDQSHAWGMQMRAERDSALRELERVRRVCRAAGIDYATGGAS